MKYIISGRNIKFTAVADDAATIKNRAKTCARARDSKGRFCNKNGSHKSKWMRFFVLAKPA